MANAGRPDLEQHLSADWLRRIRIDALQRLAALRDSETSHGYPPLDRSGSGHLVVARSEMDLDHLGMDRNPFGDAQQGCHHADPEPGDNPRHDLHRVGEQRLAQRPLGWFTTPAETFTNTSNKVP